MRRSSSTSSSERGPLLLVAKAASLALAVLVPAAIWVESRPMAFFNQEYALWRYQRDVVTGEIDVGSPGTLVLGDSRAMAGILPGELADDALSICTGGATPIDLRSALERYLAHHEPPETIVLSISPFHLQAADAFWHRTVKFEFVPFGELWRVLGREDEFDPGLLTPEGSLLAGRARLVGMWLGLVTYYHMDLAAGGVWQRGESNREVYEQIAAQRGWWSYGQAPGTREPGEEAWMGHFHPSPLLVEELRALLDLASEHGIRVAVRTPPGNDGAVPRVAPRYERRFHRLLLELAAEYPEHDVDPRWPFYPPELFGDASHLNWLGSQRFTSEVRASLERAR